MAMTTNPTTEAFIIPPSGDGKHLTPTSNPVNANSGGTASGEYKILRLKRKRNEEPLDGLRRHLFTRRSELRTRLTWYVWTVVEQALVAGESPARGDLPVRKKKHLMHGHGIFQLAETVDRHEARWDDAQWRQNLQVSG